MSEAPRKSRGIFNLYLLDDSAATRNIAQFSLEENLPCTVEVFASVNELMPKAEGSPPDLILLEDNQGHDEGLHACEQLKRNPRTAGTPVFFLSSKKEPSERVAALKAGGVDFLLKPFYPEELVTRVRIHIQIYRLRMENLAQIAEQRALLRVLCHDLVNPIFAAHSLLDLKLSLGKVDNQSASVAIKSCRSAMDIIKHVREEHTLVKTNKQFKAETTILAEALQEVCDTLSERLLQKDIELRIEQEPGLALQVKRVVLAHNVLNNLLTNAIKFSPQGSQIDISAYPLDEGDSRICVIEVRDYGIGMPPQILKNIFKDSAKTSRKGTDEEGGTGFGMPLVRRYVEKSGGAIHITSVEASKGTPKSEQGTLVKLSFLLSAKASNA